MTDKLHIYPYFSLKWKCVWGGGGREKHYCKSLNKFGRRFSNKAQTNKYILKFIKMLVEVHKISLFIHIPCTLFKCSVCAFNKYLNIEVA